MADDKFKLPGTSLEELMKIVSAYATLDREASPGEVGNLAGKHETQVSRNNGFLTAIGIIESTQRGKRVTPQGRELGRAYEHNQGEGLLLRGDPCVPRTSSSRESYLLFVCGEGWTDPTSFRMLHIPQDRRRRSQRWRGLRVSWTSFRRLPCLARRMAGLPPRMRAYP
jgi:hypothetical protein